MLHELDITDFAIIERTIIRFSSGLNALTGETGAGKSILLDALGAVLGARVSSDLVRTGARLARVEAVFVVGDEHRSEISDLLENSGIDVAADDSLILAREILASGRSSARINGRPATSAQLAALGSVLVDIHGQSDHLAILRSSVQRSMLDRFAGNADARLAIESSFRTYHDLSQRVRTLTVDSREQEQRLDLLRFQSEEIGAAALQLGEDEKLTQERTVLQNADRLRLDTEAALGLLTVDEVGEVQPNAVDVLRRIEMSIGDLQRIDVSAAGYFERATGLVVLAEDLARDLRDYLETLDADPRRLQEVDDRLAVIQGLKRKYGQSIEQILAFGEGVQAELGRMSGAEFDLDALLAQQTELESRLGADAAALSASRVTAAKALGARIESAVTDLRMGNAFVRIDVRQTEDLSGVSLPSKQSGGRYRVDQHGVDVVEYLIAPNEGEALKPLARIASGGETSRLMLALKSILSDVDTTPTLVFDEIDVGVGGRSGQVVGEKLAGLADRHQVIVVTHLPQIAAFADAHLRISKQESGNRTVSIVEELDTETRVTELAAMIDGLPITHTSRATATQMLVRSQPGQVGAGPGP